jgi:hypothetical protein
VSVSSVVGTPLVNHLGIQPSWQISLDGDLVDVLGGTPDDLESINPAVNDAYIAKLTAQGAQSWISWVREPRVMASTLELMAD